MFDDEICGPYSWEFEFYKENNIPLWECKTHEKKNLGRIYQNEDGSYIEATVHPMPAQFWEFVVYYAETQKTHEISTGSGGLQNYFNAMKGIAEGMIAIDSIK